MRSNERGRCFARLRSFIPIRPRSSALALLQPPIFHRHRGGWQHRPTTATAVVYHLLDGVSERHSLNIACLLYTSDAADE